MARTNTLQLDHDSLERLLVTVRRKKVLLDHHVAELYGVPTREVNRAVKNNPEKFLKGYVIKLNDSELRRLRWKVSTANASKRRTPPSCDLLYSFSSI